MSSRPPEETLLLWFGSLDTISRRGGTPTGDLLRIRELEFRDGVLLPMHLHLLEHPSGMECRQAEHRNRNHDAVKNDKVDLVLHDGVTPSLGHLPDTKDATDEDGEERNHNAGNEKLEAGVVGEFDGGGFEA